MEDPRRRRSPAVDAVVSELEAQALDRHGVITRAQLAAAGLSRSVADKRVDEGRWRHPRAGVFTIVDADGGPLQDVAVALAAAGPKAFAQRRSAAKVLGGLDQAAFGAADVAVPLGASNRRWPRRRVPPGRIVVEHDLRTTDHLQTLLDLASVLSDLEWEWALESALRHRRTSVRDLEALLLLPARKDRTAVDRARRVLALRPMDAPPTDSVLETRFVQLARRHGLPEPIRQLLIEVSPMVRFYLDLCWPEHGVFLELDGRGHHDQPTYDARRQTLVTAATGWLCARCTWREVVGTPKTTARSVRAILDQGHALQAARTAAGID